MKVEIEIPDELVPFFELEAKQRRMTVAELLEAKVFSQSHMVTGDWPTAPPERETTPGIVPDTLSAGFTEGEHEVTPVGDDEPPEAA